MGNFKKENKERISITEKPPVIYLRNKAEQDYMIRRHANVLKQMGLPDISSPRPRRPLPKEPLRRPPGSRYRMLIKFNDRFFARASKEGSLTISGENISPKLISVIQEYGILFSPNHTVGEDSLVMLEAQALISTQEEPADLGGMLVASTSSSDPETVCAAANALQQLDVIEFVSLSSVDFPPPPPGPVDIPPTSSLLSAAQIYRGTNGINADDVWNRFGVKGQGVRITDCEYLFNSTHEDLADLVTPQPGSIVYYSGFSDDHGTAVLGILTAAENSYGMTGMVPLASVNFYPENATVNGTSQSRSACIAASLTGSARGDVVLLEMQTYGSGSTTGDARYVAAEYDQDVWLVVKTGTDAGKHVVAAAGNGGQDLDGANYADYRNRGDSGAIIVGAGSTNRAWLSYSTFGSRVNLQGWGDWSVATLGYGDYFTYGNDPNQKYTKGFSGTSSASPIVASSVVLIESYVRQRLNRSLAPSEMRRILVANGKPQTGSLSQKIGPLPDLSTTLTSLAAQVITWTNPAAITYGTALTATQLNASSSVAGTFAYNPAIGSILNAGTNTLTAVFTASNPTNYVSPLTNTVSLVVAKATPVITWTNPAAITYGTALTATQLNASSSVAGTFAYNPAIGSILNAGTNTLTAVFTASNPTNYVSPLTNTVSLVVNKATPVITWANPAAITYGTALTATQLNASSSVAGTFAYTPTNGSILSVGTNTLTAIFTASNATNYVSPLTNTVSLVVNSAYAFNLTEWLKGQTMSPAILAKLAIGGASSALANDGEIPVVTLDSDKLFLSAIVRTNGPVGLVVVGEVGASLTNWSTNGVAVTTSTNTNEVPVGHQRRVFSIDRSNSATRQFLRLKATMP